MHRPALAALLFTTGCYDLSQLRSNLDEAVAGPDAGGCPHLLCADFENDLDPTVWTPADDNGQFVYDGRRFHGGARAIHFSTVAQPNGGGHANGMIAETATVAAADPFFVRAWIYLPATLQQYFTLFEASTDVRGIFVAFGTRDGTLQIDPGGLAATLPTSTPIPTGTWVCLEWELHRRVAGATAAWLGGTALPSLSAVLQTSQTANVQRVAIGLHVYGALALPAADLWLDDLAIDSAPIGCS
jgi:hypothetical protein